MVKIGDILESVEDYCKLATFCNDNGLIIKKLEDGKFLIEGQPQQTEEEKILAGIEALKAKLASTDYKAIQFAEGVLSLAEFDPIREKRKAWREKINFLENSLKNI